MQDIANWLKAVCLGEYAQRFADNAIDLSVIRDLTEQDLRDLGVLLLHRRKILRAIAELPAAPAPTETATEPALRDAPERRHLTVMICDLVGSTALSSRLDPEDMRAVIDAYHAACARITRSYDGFLAEFRGDGILAYFGYPFAHEDDAERTVRAGLEIIAAVARLETRAAEPLAVRIGIATGVVVVGEGALREHAVVGETPNLAARLQSLAEPGTIVVAASTRRLLGNTLELVPAEVAQMEQIAEQPARGGSDDDRPGLGQGLKAGCKVRRLPDHSVLPQRTLAAEVADHHHAGRDANANRERFSGARLEAGNGDSLGIVFVREGIAEIGQYAVAPELGKVAVIG